MKYDPIKKCIVNDDGSFIEMSGTGNGCRGHDSGIGNKYKCARTFCGGDFQRWLVRELYDLPLRKKAA